MERKRVEMTYQEFRDYVEENFRLEGMEDAPCCIDSVLKNNDVELWKLFVDVPEKNISPALYLEPFYRRVLEGDPAEDVLYDIENEYRKILERRPGIDQEEMDNILSEEQIVFNLVHYRMNRKKLKNCPYVRIMDLAMEFRYATSMKEKSYGSVLITNDIFEKLDMSREKLLRLAMENTMRIFPPVVFDMEIFQKRFFRDPLAAKEVTVMRPDQIRKGQFMYVLTNEHMVYGAGALIYEGVLNTIADRLCSDLMILPSSVHEIIMVPVDDMEDTIRSVPMVRQVNRSMMDPTDVLSYSVYYFDRKSGKLILAQEETP